MQLQKTILAHFFRGDIDNQEVVEFWSPTPIPKTQVLRMYKRLVIPMLVPAVCPLFPRSRWIGAELCTSWAGILASLHGLLQPLLLKWGAPQGLPTRQLQRPALSLKTFADGWQTVASADAAEGPFDAHAEESAWAEPPEYDPMSAGDAEKELLDHATGNVDWAKINASTKLRCARWANHVDTRATLVAMRACMHPCLALMHGLLSQAGAKWERKQQCASSGRSYRVLEAPRLSSDSMRMLMQAFRSPVPALAWQDQKRRIRVLMFRLLVSAGGALHHLLGNADAGYPFKLFRLALPGNPYLAEELFKDPPCLYDELTAKVLSDYPSPEAVTSPKALAVLTSLADMVMLDIAGIEARHAAARRITAIRSMQNDALSFESLASLTASRSCRNARAEWLEARSGKPQAKLFGMNQKKKKKKAKPNKKHSGGGGPWRAFTHLSKAGFGKAKALSKEYRRIKAQAGPEFSELRRVGGLATIASRAGHPGFGRRPREKKAKHPQLQNVMPAALADKLAASKADCRKRSRENANDWQQDLQQLAIHGNRLDSELRKPAEQDKPAGALVSAMTSSVLPLPSSLLMLECMPPAAEATKDCEELG